MITIKKWKPCRAVAKGKNLRVILEYARKHGIKSVNTMATVGGHGWLYVYFQDGAFTEAHFESHNVLQSWLVARRSWNLNKPQTLNNVHFSYEVIT